MKLPENATQLDLGVLPGYVTAEQAAQVAGRIARGRGADQISVTVVDEFGREAPGDVLRSPSYTFRVQAIAQFPSHTVIGSTHPIDRDDWRAHSSDRYAHWQIAACAHLIKQFAPLTPEEATSCRNV